ncbi:glycine betaine ABC transporter substrate-binding protein [Thioalkalivibrio sp. ALJ16]|uniref:glycine betaine ABC transporter substrate-binding protein n=1 Tax=Thioalkalivibrio sp. ALJ16 TaxID=1158762 RepID=UPI00036E5A17|nr:glycine betaine ABC transporter substrate-binding protein [Thioalkalivibrio sp. ALJ16]
MNKTVTSTLLGGVLAASMSLSAAQADDIQIGWTAWSDAEFVTKLAERVIEDELGYSVDLVQTDIAPQYQGLASGDIDLMLMAWLPGTHEDYMERVGQDVVNLGPLYGNARLGWAVPDYIPEDELSSITDLKKDEVRDRLDGRITGIDPGAGLTRLSERALETYDLDGYSLQISSGAGMTSALDRAIRRDEWIVVTGWSPHWKFGAYELRYLEDPEEALGGFERIHALAREGFAEEYHDVAMMISRMHLNLDVLEEAMFYAQENSYEEAVDRFIEDHPQYIAYWVSGEID